MVNNTRTSHIAGQLDRPFTRREGAPFCLSDIIFVRVASGGGNRRKRIIFHGREIKRSHRGTSNTLRHRDISASAPKTARSTSAPSRRWPIDRAAMPPLSRSSRLAPLDLVRHFSLGRRRRSPPQSRPRSFPRSCSSCFPRGPQSNCLHSDGPGWPGDRPC